MRMNYQNFAEVLQSVALSAATFLALGIFVGTMVFAWISMILLLLAVLFFAAGLAMMFSDRWRPLSGSLIVLALLLSAAQVWLLVGG